MIVINPHLVQLLIIDLDLANREGVSDPKGCEDVKCHCHHVFGLTL